MAPILKAEIPKANGGVGKLGLSLLLERLIQRALLQVPEAEFEPDFSNICQE